MAAPTSGANPGDKTRIEALRCMKRRLRRLAWPVLAELGECDYPAVFVRPDPSVVAALTQATNMLDLCREGLPAGLGGEVKHYRG
jgi:hypothetical protein